MKKEKVCFVILHYLTISDTITCVDSIMKLYNDYSINIVIVDNGSSNNTGAKLIEFYSNNDIVKVIQSKSNLGFANGNNLGYKYAKETLKAKYIIMVNNDTVFIQKNFIDIVISDYDKYGYAVLGPKVILKDGSINPVYGKLKNTDIYLKELKNLKRDYALSYIYLYNIYHKLKGLTKKILEKLGFRSKSSSNLKYNVDEFHKNVVIHGCALVFSPKYINRFDSLNNKTFLYREEELLFLQINDANMTSVYDPNLTIIHNEDSATNTLTKTRRKKVLFTTKHKINSTKVLLDELNKK